MSHTLSIHINPEYSKFLNKIRSKNFSEQQNTLLNSIVDLHKTVEQWQSEASSVFTRAQLVEISRGAFFALTKPLEEKFNKNKTITLSDLQMALATEFKIKDEQAIHFIIKSLLEPHSIPLALPILAYSIKTNDCFWSNGCTQSDFKYSLKAEIDPQEEENILFKLQLDLKSTNLTENPPTGSTIIYFSINQKQQIKLLPLTMQFNFPDQDESQKFQQDLANSFRDWLLIEGEMDKINIKLHRRPIIMMDLCILPSLLGFLIGIIAMISVIALSLNIIIPVLILPPLGLALGLILTSLAISYVCFDTKKAKEKLQRPIYLSTQPFFNHSNSNVSQCNGHDQSSNALSKS